MLRGASVLTLGGQAPRAACLFVQQERGAKRKGVRMQRAIREAKYGLPHNHPHEIARRRRKEWAKQAEENPRVPTLEEIREAREKEIARSPSLQHPSRQFPEEAARLPDSPTDDVWWAEDYKRQRFSVAQALAMHRELRAPDLLNWPDAKVRMRAELNLNLDAKGKKCQGDMKGIVELPHPIRQMGKRTVMAFVKDEAEATKASEAGAEIIGTPDSVRKILRGQMVIDDVDYFVCYVDMLADIVPLRGLLKHKFPTKLNLGLGSDVEQLVRLHLHGTEFQIKADPIRPAWGLCDMFVGSLDMDDAAVEDNLRLLLQQICTIRAMSPKLGHTLNDVLLMAEGSEEFFALDWPSLAPALPTEEPVSEKKKASKKKALKTLEEIAAEADAKAEAAA